LNTKETKADYYSVRVFDNNTVWWFLKQCQNDIPDADITVNIFKCFTDAPTNQNLDQRREANQIRWYQTTGTIEVPQRIVYYTNGTVNRETWTWGTDNKRT